MCLSSSLPVLRNLPPGQVGSGRCCGKSTVPADSRSVTQRTLNNSAQTNPSPKWCGGWGVGEATWPVARSAGRGAGGAPPGALQHQIRRGCLNGALPPAKRSEFRAAAPRLSTAAQSAQRTTGPEATPTPHPPHHSQHGTAPPAPTNQHRKPTFQQSQHTANKPSTQQKHPHQPARANLNLPFKFKGLKTQISAFPSLVQCGLRFANDNTPACNCTGPQRGAHTRTHTPRLASQRRQAT